jgi:hypothetical protein
MVYHMAPSSLRPIMKQVLTMGFSDDPPYDQIIDGIKAEMRNHVLFCDDLQPIVHHFEWLNNHAFKLQDQILMEQIRKDKDEFDFRSIAVPDHSQRSYSLRSLGQSSMRGGRSQSPLSNIGESVPSDNDLGRISSRGSLNGGGGSQGPPRKNNFQRQMSFFGLKDQKKRANSFRP